MERLMRFNRDQKASPVFEAIDMANDPHIIDYAENKLVLLGCVRRHETFEQLGYDDLVKLASWLGCEVKERIFPKIKDWLALSKIMERVETNPDWRRSEEHTSELQSLMRISYAVFCLKTKNKQHR